MTTKIIYKRDLIIMEAFMEIKHYKKDIISWVVYKPVNYNLVLKNDDVIVIPDHLYNNFKTGSIVKVEETYILL